MLLVKGYQVSKTLSISIATKQLLVLNILVTTSKLEISLRDSPIHLLAKYAVCCEEINNENIFF